MERRSLDRDTKQALRRFFMAQPVFSGVMPRSPAWMDFLSRVELRHFNKGEVIYEPGSASRFIYLVRDGEVHIRSTSAVNFSLTSDAPRLIGIHGRGSLFGEVSFMTGEPHSSYAIASLDTGVFVVPGEAFAALMTAEASVGSAMAELLSQRLRQSLASTPSESPAHIHVLFYPEDPTRGSEICTALAKALMSENPGPVLLLTINPASIFADADAAPSGESRRSRAGREDSARALSKIMEGWPKTTLDQILDFVIRPEGGFDVLLANEVYGMDLNLDRLVAVMPDILGRLRKYYAMILVDAGGFVENPVLSRILSQGDNLMIVQNPATNTDSRSGRRFREVVAYCTELLDDFFERVIMISDLCEARTGGVGDSRAPAAERFFPGINLNSALYRQHLELACVSGDPAHRIQERSFQIGVNRLARRLSGTSRGLALGGGGARAFAHIGVIEVLDEEGIDFDSVAGTSMGAVVACAYAMGRDASEIAYLVKEIIPDSRAIFDKGLPFVSFFRGRKLNQAILSAFGDTRFEDLQIPFFCNAADLNTAQSVIFESGYVSTAIRASVSLPGVFPPVQLDPYDLVDGGILNNLPGSVLRDKGYHRIIGVNVTPIEDHRSAQTQVEDRRGGIFEKIRDYFTLPPILKIIYRSTTIQGIELLKFRMQKFDYIFHPPIGDYDIFDFHRRDEIIESGRRAARDHLQEIKETLYRPNMS
ncbi:MAG: patatin-like phospholipase family protein [bacterium]|nr:patatin-like phospholipase family protein [bacterium]